jgi:spermidine dehydrogenase
MITRRDFLNGVLLGSGAGLLAAAAPGEPSAAHWYDGPSGVGDYANCNGNTWQVVDASHQIRGRNAQQDLAPIDTGESHELVIVGSGMSGLGAAFYYSRLPSRRKSCLMLDNHPVFGGESKRNEFVVNGRRLLAPQGANEFSIHNDPKDDGYEIFEALRIPRRFEYQKWPPDLKPLEFDRTNYGFHHWIYAPSFGHYLDGRWVRNFWESDHASEEFQKWRTYKERPWPDGDHRQWLDRMSYQEYIEKHIGVSNRVTEYAHPITAAALGLGCDATSAYAASQIGMAGFRGLNDGPPVPEIWDKTPEHEFHMFPDGNTGFARFFVKVMIPAAIAGPHTLDGIINGRIRFALLDQHDAPFRLRLGATVVRVEQDRHSVAITYLKAGRVYKTRAQAVVMATGGWVVRNVVHDLPREKHEAYKRFLHSAVLVVNVAVSNWRFLYDLGLTAGRWRTGFGFSCNIRRQMIMPGYAPRLAPDSPNVITFYIPLFYPGLPAREQGVKGREELLSKPYAEYERKTLLQLRELFGAKAVKAVAGIILNRWGHAYVNPVPGFYTGDTSGPAPSDVIRQVFGRIGFAHSELNGHQFWLGGIREGRRAVTQLADVLKGT